MGTDTNIRARRYGLYFLFATLAGLFLFSKSLTQSLITRDPTPWWGLPISFLLGTYLIALLSPAVLWLGRRKFTGLQ